MKEFIINSQELKNDYIEINELIENNLIKISLSVFEDILFNKKNYKKLIQTFNNSRDFEIRVFQNYNLILKSSKISFLEACILFLKTKRYENSNVYKEIMTVYDNLYYEKFINKKDIHRLMMDNNEYKIPLYYYFDFLSSNNYDDLLENDNYKDIPIDKFIYGLVSFCDINQIFSRFVFSSEIKKRFLEIKRYEKIDYQSINKILEIKDKYGKKVRISQDVFNIINKHYDDDKLRNIIKVYLELCNFFTYDEQFYIDNNNKKHDSISYLPYINRYNTKMVCYEFPEIFGAFLKRENINYEINNGSRFYGLEHNYLVFRYGKFLIKVEPVKTVYNSDFTTVKTNLPLVGFTCLNENEETRKEFSNIVKECYTPEDIDLYNECLPANKIENDKVVSESFKDYLIKFDVIFKKINDKKLEPIEKADYFIQLIKFAFNDLERENRISCCFVTNYRDLIYIITYNDVNIENDNNIYLIYDNNHLSFIKKEELEELFLTHRLNKLSKKEIPGINIKKEIKGK